MKDILSKLFLVSADFAVVLLSLILAFELRFLLDGVTTHVFMHNLLLYLNLPMLYIVPLLMFAYEGIYAKRHDFWQESWLIIKSILFSSIIIFAYLAVTQEILSYSRLVIILFLIFIIILAPIMKLIMKKLLYKSGLWKKKARVYGCDQLVKDEVFTNYYLGYIDAKEHDADTVFVNGNDIPKQQRDNLISMALASQREVVFIPTMQDFDLSMSQIGKLQNTRTNLVYFQNRLASKIRQSVQILSNYMLALLLLPLLIPIIMVIAFLIKQESKGSIFFSHKRIGKNGRLIPTFKFRSMYCDAEIRLQKMLQEDDKIREEWDTTFKLKNDPRITKVGSFLRKTSLDELPQIFNVLRGEMNFVGPRPVIQDELDKYYKEDAKYYLMVKPGISGLWQVSGRSDTDYDFRVVTDKWYVLNWSLWLDMIILFKTVKVVLKRDGAY